MVSYMHGSRHAINVGYIATIGCIGEFYDSIVILKTKLNIKGEHYCEENNSIWVKLDVSIST